MKRTAEKYDGNPDETGTLFVDILFALVVTQILTPLKDPEKTTFLGGLHLGVAFVLTLLSWIGYHNSRSRADARLRFPTFSKLDNRFGKSHVNDWHYYSFLQFLLDVTMVVVYWMASITYERSTKDGEVRQDLFWYWPSRPSAFPEAFAVVISFVLYAAWDWVGRREGLQIKAAAEKELDKASAMSSVAPGSIATKNSRLRIANSRHRDAEATMQRRRNRQWPTLIFGTQAVGVLAVAFFWRSYVGVFVLDVVLIGVLLMYRYFKEFAVADMLGS